MSVCVPAPRQHGMYVYMYAGVDVLYVCMYISGYDDVDFDLGPPLCIWGVSVCVRSSATWYVCRCACVHVPLYIRT